MNLELILKDIDDPYVRENFKRISNIFNTDNLLKGEFKFFEKEIIAANTTILVSHGLNFVPQDIIILSIDGDFNFYFKYQEFDRTNISIYVSGPVKLRFFAGVYKDPNYGRMLSDFTLIPPNASNGIGTTWFTGSGVPAPGLGVVGDFYLNLTNKDIYLKTGLLTWTLEGTMEQPTPASDVSIDTLAATNSAVGSQLQDFINRLFEESESQAPTYNVNGTINHIEIFTSPTQITANRTSRVDLTYDVDLQPLTEAWKFYSLSNGTTILKTVTITYTWTAGVLTNQTQVTA
jgi:hypothetical protein